MKKPLFYIGIFLVSTGLIVKIVGDILRFLKTEEKIKEVEKRVVQLEEEKRKLSQKYQYYQSSEFIEEEARNKLNMARPGETVIILPPNFQELIGSKKGKQEEKIPNWKRWWKLFF